MSTPGITSDELGAWQSHAVTIIRIWGFKSHQTTCMNHLLPLGFSQQAENGLMEIRAASMYARILWERLDEIPNARQRLRDVFDKYDTLSSQPNFFTPLRLTGLTSAMVSKRGRE